MSRAPGERVVVTPDADICRVRLDDAEGGNRLDTEDLRRLGTALEELAALEPAAIVLEASGADFCLGRDPSGDGDAAAARASLASVLELGARIRRLSTLLVVSLRGRARGLGAGIVLHADLAVAASTADLAFDEVERGFPPTLVMTYIEDYLPRKVARELLTTGRPLAMAEAERLGVVNRVVEEAELERATNELAALLAARERAALAACKPLLAEFEGLPAERRAERGLEAGSAFFARAAH